MKIKINDFETYEIKIPNEVNPKEFLEILSSFENIVKLIRLNNIPKQMKDNADFILDENKAKIGKAYKRKWCDTREKTLDLMQYAYHGTNEDKQRIEKICGVIWNNITKSFYNLQKRYNIKPQEVGLIKFGNKHQKGNLFKIPNYIIKSYTGVFDENGNN